MGSKVGYKVTVDKSALEDILKNLPDGLNIVGEKVTADIEAYAKEHMSRTAPFPSAPGSPPAVQTGRLKGSITHYKLKDSEQWTVVAGGDQAPYAKYLEYGTRKMAARPFMRPAMLAIAETVPELLKLEIVERRVKGYRKGKDGVKRESGL